jgi:AcrR family transcriptional regulator
MHESGLARSTTKEIARAAGYSEGTLYKHFESKEDPFPSVLAERLPSFLALVEELPERVGRGTVRETLEEVASKALAFYGEIVPAEGEEGFVEGIVQTLMRSLSPSGE